MSDSEYDSDFLSYKLKIFYKKDNKTKNILINKVGPPDFYNIEKHTNKTMLEYANKTMFDYAYSQIEDLCNKDNIFKLVYLKNKEILFTLFK